AAPSEVGKPRTHGGRVYRLAEPLIWVKHPSFDIDRSRFSRIRVPVRRRGLVSDRSGPAGPRGSSRGVPRLAATGCSPGELPVFTQSQNSIALTWLEVGRKSYGKQPLSRDTPMLAVLKSHRSPRHLCGALAICLALIASGCGGGGYGGSSSGGSYNPTPAISGLAPASASAGAAAQTLTINGSGFMATSTVTYNGVPHTAAFVSATQLTIQLTAADQAMLGSYAVIVTNPPPGGGASASVSFTVGNPVPVISGLMPASVTA